MTKSERAESLFREGFNCAQAVFCAFAPDHGLDEETAKRIACGLGGGVGRLREVCGAVTGAALVLGLRGGTDRTEVYAKVQKLAADFRSKMGSYICRDHLAGTGATTGGAPEARTSAYYRARPCIELVRAAAELLEADDSRGR